MNYPKLVDHFSLDRLDRFYKMSKQQEDVAARLYQYNLLLSESLYPVLYMLELTLRNAIHRELTRKYGRADWYADWYKDPVLCQPWNKINYTITEIHKRGKPLTPGQVVSQMNFGFWTSLFNDVYEPILWQQLRFVFPNLPKPQRQRPTVAKPLNDIRIKLRNRVYHYEPIVNRIHATEQACNDALKLIQWMSSDAIAWLQSLERYQDVMDEIKQFRTMKGI